MKTKEVILLLCIILSFCFAVKCFDLVECWEGDFKDQGEKFTNFSVQDNICEEYSFNSSMPDFPITRIGTPPQDIYSHSRVFYQDNNKININFAFRPSKDDTRSSVKGFLLNITSVSVCNNQTKEIVKYVCLTNGTKIPRKVFYRCIFAGFLPGAKISYQLDTIPAKNNSNRRTTINEYEDGWNEISPKIYTLPDCNDPRLSNITECQIQNNVSLRILAHEQCSDEDLHIALEVPEYVQHNVSLLIWNKTHPHLSLNSSSVTFEVPKSFFRQNSTYNISAAVCNASIKKSRKSFILPPCAENSLSVSILLIIIFVTFIVCMFALVFAWKRWRSSKNFTHIYVDDPVVTTLPCEGSNKRVYLGYLDTRNVFKNVAVSFAKYLRQDMGIDVKFEPWAVLTGVSYFVEEMLEDCDKFIIVWSMESIKSFTEGMTTEKLGRDNVSFLSIAKQLERFLLLDCIDRSKIASVYFDKKCADLIPEWFCKLVDKHFCLMEQFEQLYAYLSDVHKYYPHAKLMQNEVEGVGAERLELLIKKLRAHNSGLTVEDDGDCVSIISLNVEAPDEGNINEVDIEIVPPSCPVLLSPHNKISPPKESDSLSLINEVSVNEIDVCREDCMIEVVPPDEMLLY